MADSFIHIVGQSAGAAPYSLNEGTHRVRLGRSFTALLNSSSSSPTFHTFRYDFKPASIDLEKPGKVITGEREDDVTVSLPHVAESSSISTLFGGNQRPVDKECVLIVDKQTGEMILELVSTAVNLKRIRDEARPGLQTKLQQAQTTPTSSTAGDSEKPVISNGSQPSKPQTQHNGDSSGKAKHPSTADASNKKSQPPKKVGRVSEESSTRFPLTNNSQLLADVQNQLALSDEEDEIEKHPPTKPVKPTTSVPPPSRPSGSVVKEPGKVASNNSSVPNPSQTVKPHHHHHNKNTKPPIPSNLSSSSPSSMSSSGSSNDSLESGSDVEEPAVSRDTVPLPQLGARREGSASSANLPAAPPARPLKYTEAPAGTKNFKAGCGRFVDCDASSEDEHAVPGASKKVAPAPYVNVPPVQSRASPSLSFSEDEESAVALSLPTSNSTSHRDSHQRGTGGNFSASDLYQDLMLSEDEDGDGSDDGDD